MLADEMTFQFQFCVCAATSFSILIKYNRDRHTDRAWNVCASPPLSPIPLMPPMPVWMDDIVRFVEMQLKLTGWNGNYYIISSVNGMMRWPSDDTTIPCPWIYVRTVVGTADRLEYNGARFGNHSRLHARSRTKRDQFHSLQSESNGSPLNMIIINWIIQQFPRFFHLNESRFCHRQPQINRHLLKRDVHHFSSLEPGTFSRFLIHKRYRNYFLSSNSHRHTERDSSTSTKRMKTNDGLISTNHSYDSTRMACGSASLLCAPLTNSCVWVVDMPNGWQPDDGREINWSR